jgi:alkanesulfonate monooxygenase
LAFRGSPRKAIKEPVRLRSPGPEELAWDKTHRIVDDITAVRKAGGPVRHHHSGTLQNTGPQRLCARRELAERGDRFDRALWTATAAATGGAGNSNALVGTPETVAQALLDHVDLGVDILSMRGYDTLNDAIDIGRYVIPIVREEVADRNRERDAATAR